MSRSQHCEASNFTTPELMSRWNGTGWDTVSVGAVYKFRSFPGPDPGQVVREGVIEHVISLGNRRYRLVFQRDLQFSDVDRNGGSGPSWNVVWGSMCGGNICETREDMRVWSRANPLAIWGPSGGARPGMGFRLIKGATLLPPMKMDVAVAYGYPPIGGVNYNGPGAVRKYVARPELYDLTINRPGDPNAEEEADEVALQGGEIHFEPSAAEPWAGTELNWFNETALTQGVCERVVYQIGGVDDPDYYPPNAAFAQDTTPQYWASSGLEDIRVSQAVAAQGDPGDTISLFLTFWERGVNYQAEVPGSTLVVIEGTGSGYGSTSDSVTISAESVEAEFSVDYVVTYGAGAAEWRLDNLAGERSLRVWWDSDGIITGASWREDLNGAAASIDIGGSIAIGFPMQLRIYKSGTTVYIQYYDAIGEVWTEVASATFTESGSARAMVGISTTGATKFFRVGASTRGMADYGGGGGRQSVMRRRNSAFAGWTDYALPLPGETPTSFRNTQPSPDIPMTLIAPPIARNTYTPLAGNFVRFYAPANGDAIEIVYPPAAGGAAPGLAPRVTANQINFAERVDDNFTASTNVATNKANHHDYAEIVMELAVEPSPGDHFQITMDGVWDPDDPPTIYWDRKHDETHDWEELDESEFVALYWAGYIFPTQDFLTGDVGGNGKQLCLKPEGEIIDRSIGPRARTWNEWRDVFQELYRATIPMDRFFVTGGGTAITGFVRHTIGAIEFECIGGVPTATTLGWGTDRWNAGGDRGYGQAYWAAGAVDRPPYYHSYRLPSPEQVSPCGGPPPEILIVNPEDVLVTFDPSGNYWPSASNFFGSWLGWDPTSQPLPAAAGGFDFTAIRLNVPDWMKNGPDGIEIVAAWAELVADGVETELHEFSAEWDDTNEDGERWWRINGELVFYELIEGGSTIVNTGVNLGLAGENSIGGSVSFALIGVRDNTSSPPVITPGGVFNLDVWNRIYRALGPRIPAVNVQPGIAQIVDLTAVVQAMFDNLHENDSRYELWAAVQGPIGSPGPDENLGEWGHGLIGYDLTATGRIDQSYTASGKFRRIWFDSYVFRNAMVQIKFADGTEALRCLHMPTPRMM